MTTNEIRENIIRNYGHPTRIEHTPAEEYTDPTLIRAFGLMTGHPILAELAVLDQAFNMPIRNFERELRIAMRDAYYNG